MLDINSTTPIKSISIADHEIQFDVNQNGLPVARHYRRLTSGKNKGELKRLEGYYFSNAEQRLTWVNKLLVIIAKRESEQITRDLAKKDALDNFQITFKVGDVLYDSWGYEQTNIDFYQVVELGKKTIKIRAIKGEMVEWNRGDSGKIKPVIDDFDNDEILTKSVGVTVYNGKAEYSIKGKSGRMYPYTNGEKGVYCSWGY